MTIRKLWDKFSFNDCQDLKNYIPYQYQIDIEIKDKQVQDWQKSMWMSYFEKQDAMHIYHERVDRIFIYADHQIQIPKRKTVLGTTYLFKVKEFKPKYDGGVELGMKNILTKKINVDWKVFRYFPYASKEISFDVDNLNGFKDKWVVETYIKLMLDKICNKNHIQYAYDRTCQFTQILSFEPIKQEVIDQIKKELGDFIKNENC